MNCFPFIQYDKALQTLSEARVEVEESVASANKSTWEGFRNMLLYDGFKANGDNFVKHTVVGATLLDNLYEDHAIKGYDYYEAEIPDDVFRKDITDAHKLHQPPILV